MRGHWESGTRKLNRHYQSGGGGVGYVVEYHFDYARSEAYPAINRITNSTGGLDIPLIPLQAAKKWTAARYVVTVRIIDDIPAPLYLYPWTAANLAQNLRLPIYNADGSFDRWQGSIDVEFTTQTTSISPMIYNRTSQTWTESTVEADVYEIDRRLTFTAIFPEMAAGEYATYFRFAGLWMDTMQDDRYDTGTYNVYWKNEIARTIKFEVMPI